jgi:hypothetical protein
MNWQSTGGQSGCTAGRRPDHRHRRNQDPLQEQRRHGARLPPVRRPPSTVWPPRDRQLPPLQPRVHHFFKHHLKMYLNLKMVRRLLRRPTSTLYISASNQSVHLWAALMHYQAAEDPLDDIITWRWRLVLFVWRWLTSHNRQAHDRVFIYLFIYYLIIGKSAGLKLLLFRFLLNTTTWRT